MSQPAEYVFDARVPIGCGDYRQERTTAAQFAIDDRLPAIVLPGRSGRPVDLGDQHHAGQALAFWVTAADVSAARVAETERLAPSFRGCDATLIHLVTARPSPAVPDVGSDALLQLFDPDGVLPAALGLAGPGVIVVDRGQRLRAVIADGTPADALELCRAHHARAPSGVIGGHPPVLVIAQVCEPDLCRQLIDYWERGAKEENAVALRTGGSHVGASYAKRRADVVIQDRALYETVKRRIELRVAPEMLKTLHFTPARIEALRIGCYDAANQGEFRRHRDNMTPYTAHRKFAMSLNLNAPDYEGGALAFPEYGRQVYRPDAGEAVIFSCSLLHQAEPVTRGRRFGLFTFFTDAAGAEQEAAMIAKHGAAVRRYEFD